MKIISNRSRFQCLFWLLHNKSFDRTEKTFGENEKIVEKEKYRNWLWSLIFITVKRTKNRVRDGSFYSFFLFPLYLFFLFLCLFLSSCNIELTWMIYDEITVIKRSRSSTFASILSHFCYFKIFLLFFCLSLSLSLSPSLSSFFYLKLFFGNCWFKLLLLFSLYFCSFSIFFPLGLIAHQNGH